MKFHPLKLKSILQRAACSAFVTLLALAAPPTHAQMGDMPMPSAKATPTLASEAATATVALGGATIEIHYNTPHMRGRKIMGELVPYGNVWRTGANPATTVVTSAPLMFGKLLVPAGTHTLYTLPSEDAWQLILNNQTGQWGTVYKPEMDLGRIPMQSQPMSTPQEVMSITFEHTTTNSTQLHIRWETTDRYVTITRP
ncbi:MAG TPA: DUF2911 domain-containing protein [Acidobacteriaceae bacterium]|nr:DUF2911 domain-containing protein [Acidobacteriaceae bacterium]